MRRLKSTKKLERESSYYMEKYYSLNYEKIQIQKKQYREKNKEKLKVKKCEKILCECGVQYTRSNKARHLQSMKHIEHEQTFRGS